MIIALTGPSKGGKDTAARYLCKAWRMTCKVSAENREPWNPLALLLAQRQHQLSTATSLALADPLRDAADVLGLPADLTRERKDETHPVLRGATGRGVLLALGKTVRDVLGDDYMACLGVERAVDAESLCEGRLVIVTDVRREVEARTLQAAGARLLFVDRGIDPNSDVLFGPEWPAIQALKPATLSNRGGLAELQVACRGVVEALRAEVRTC